jgi:release factor glutamine methyltransferase
MTIQEAYKTLLFQLYEIYTNREAALIANMVIENITGLSKIDRIINKEFKLTESENELLLTITEKLLAHIPVQYAINECWFGSNKFYVDENVLIPRPETEELIKWIIDDIKKSSENLKILDIGTGSGCIPITLKSKLPHAEIYALDISEGALSVAAKNAEILTTTIKLIQTDFLEEKNWDIGQFDVIVSNPPYVKASEKEEMKRNVVLYEPHLALFVEDNDPMLFYRKIAKFGIEHLKANGIIYVEINESLGLETKKCFESLNYTVELKKDLQHKDRMIKAFSRH